MFDLTEGRTLYSGILSTHLVCVIQWSPNARAWIWHLESRFKVPTGHTGTCELFRDAYAEVQRTHDQILKGEAQ